ncbi:transposase for insertion sequence element [Corynebacterium variabile DSM 44702]|uniref:Transposase for insertion sequence element n=3 Tax=Corynebacterium variabile TaxID=1727 RepID=G0HD46_CORVD|nr:transposase for insertion sequence element [Corynebacterium variabile DSM 44702]
MTRTNYLTERQKQRLNLLWATDDGYVALQVTWAFYQDVIAAYGHPDKSRGKKLMSRVIDALRQGLPAGLEELAQYPQFPQVVGDLHV